MQPESDAQLLRAYAERGVEAAFTELVHRHTNLVYSAAWRQVDSAEAAAEIAQRVFIGLARGAQTLLPRLAADASLAGWLCRSARNLSLNHRRDEFRRQTRERQAMEQLITLPDNAPDWERLRRVLDDAMAELSETDYDALVLRFFQQQDFRTVGTALGVSDDTAQKRVARALETLRDHLSRRGISTTAAALALVISANAVQAAPAGLAAAVSAAALLAGTAVSTSTLIAATKTIAMTTLQKTLVAVTIAALAGTGIYEARQAAQLREQNQALVRAQAPLADQIRQLQRERDEAANLAAGLRAKLSTANTNSLELMRLRSDATRLQQDSKELGQIRAAISQPKKEKTDAKNDFVNLAIADAREQMTNSITKRLANLKAKIELTPDQEQQITGILMGDIEVRVQAQMSALTGGLSLADVQSQDKSLLANEDAQIVALLNQDQQAAYGAMKTEQAANSAMNYAKAEAQGMSYYLDLSPEQAQAVVSILAGLPAGQGGPGNAQDANAKQQLEIRLQALSQALTPDQLEKYRAQKLGQIQQAAIGFQMMKALAK